MQETTTTLANRPVWVDLSSTDPNASMDFYRKVFGWQIDVSDDPQYGGYGLARIDGTDVAGIGSQMSPGAPSAWNVYIATDDVEDLSSRVEQAGGTVVAPAFDVGEMGRMAVFRDPGGAFISAWQAGAMRPEPTGGPNTFGWPELNTRDLERSIPFYEQVFGWDRRTSPMGPDAPDYTEFLLAGESIAGAQPISTGLPADVPSYWMAYFSADDVDELYRKAIDAGATEMVSPSDFPGGRFAIVMDPQGAMFGILKGG
jgi:predicted enzyme related to lactoylglutathione lyase